MRRLGSHVSRHVVGYIALFVALGGTSYGVATGFIDSREIKNNTVRGKDIRNSTIRSRDVANGGLLATDFASGQLPAGERGPAGANGATDVTTRFSGEGTIGPGGQPLGAAGGSGGNAACEGETGCVLAQGGAGGNGGDGGNGGKGGSGNCSGSCASQGGAGGAGGSTGSVAQPGEGAIVGLRASCLAGERAVGGGVRASGRDAITYRSHPATATSTTPAAGETPTAWYIEAYNQSRAGENRPGVSVTVQAYAVCASP